MRSRSHGYLLHVVNENENKQKANSETSKAQNGGALFKQQK